MRESLARQGTSGPSQPYPHRAAIEQRTGMDLSGLSAHTDENAQQATRAMGAEGFYFEGAVAFASQPDLELATHEAAHHAGHHDGVCLSGEGPVEGGQEQEANEVAEATVAGEEVEAEPVSMERVGRDIGNWTSDLVGDAARAMLVLEFDLLKHQDQIPEEYSFREAMIDATFGAAKLAMGLIFERSVTTAASKLDALFDNGIHSKSRLKGFVSLNLIGTMQAEIKAQMAQRGTIEPKTLSTAKMLRDFREGFDETLLNLLRGARDTSLGGSDAHQRDYRAFLGEMNNEDFGGQARLSALEAYLEVAALASAHQRSPANGGSIGNELFLVEVTAAGPGGGFADIKLPAAVPALDRETYFAQATLSRKRLLLVDEDWMGADRSLIEYNGETGSVRGLSYAEPSKMLIEVVREMLPERSEELDEALRCARHLHIDQERTGVSIWSEQVFNTLTGNEERTVDPVSHDHLTSDYRKSSEAGGRVHDLLEEALGLWFQRSIAMAGGVDVPMKSLKGNVRWS